MEAMRTDRRRCLSLICFPPHPPAQAAVSSSTIVPQCLTDFAAGNTGSDERVFDVRSRNAIENKEKSKFSALMVRMFQKINDLTISTLSKSLKTGIGWQLPNLEGRMFNKL